MSLFARVAARAGLPGAASGPLAVPKGLAGAGLFRATADDDETEAAPLRRAAPLQHPDEDPARPLRRAAAAPPAEDDEAAAPLRRAPPAPEREDEPPDEPQALPARRATAEDGAPEEQPEGTAAALRRAEAEAEDEDDSPPAAPLRRSPPPAFAAPDAETLDAETSPKPPVPAAGKDLPGLRALRREAATPPSAPAAAWEAAPAGLAPIGPALAVAPFVAPFVAPPPLPRPGAASAERPRVVIEHVEVRVQEPAAAPAAPGGPDLGRALRARYLGS